MAYISIAEKLTASVSTDGEIGDEMANLLFSSFNDPNVWSPIAIDCAMPKSSFYVAKLNSDLSPSIVNDDDEGHEEDEDEDVYAIVRYTKDDIFPYLNYLRLEFQSYEKLEEQVNEIILPIGYKQNPSEEGFFFVFLTSTSHTLEDVIDDIKDLSLQTRFTYVINLINIVDEAFTKENVEGFHITPKTILVNLQSDEESIGLIGFVGTNETLNLCPTALQFAYNEKVSPAELKKKVKPTIRAPDSKSDVFGLAKIVQLIIGDELPIPEYKKLLFSALQKSQSNRLSLNDFKNQMLNILTEVSAMDEMQTSNSEIPQTPTEDSTQAPPSTEQVPPPVPKVRLADKIKSFCICLPTEEGCPQIYKLPKTIINAYTEEKLMKVIVGLQSNDVNYEMKNEIRILIVGQTGSGKTTVLNGFANYLYGVEWKDNFRFVIVSDEDEGQKGRDKNQAQSQTDHVTAYTFPWQPEFPVPFTVTIIDTPGFADTKGVKKDKEIAHQLESLFNNKQNCGVDSLNAVAFVVQSCLPRLNVAQKYVFESIMALFGNDIANNFIIVATFADGKAPEVLSAIREANIPTTHVSKFNNSALFAPNSGEEEQINRFFWEIGLRGYASIFTTISQMEPKSLFLTKNVLDERQKLHVSIDGLSRRVRDGIAKMNEIEAECRIIAQCKTDIQANKNFKTKVKVFKSNKLDLKAGEYVTNCSKCNKTCHYPCYIPNDDGKHGCAAMNGEGQCNVCGCHWTMHFNMQFRWESYEVEEERTLEELKRKYGDAKSKKQTRKKMLENAQNEYKRIWDLTAELLNRCKNCIIRLQSIALRPIALSEIDYIKLQIESEKQRCESGWQMRVQWLQELLEQQLLIQKINDGNGNIMPHQMLQIKDIKDQRIKNFFTNIIGFSFQKGK